MTPDKIAKGSEHSHQAAYFCWISCNKQCEPLQFAFAIPNGGLRNKQQASKLKAEGVRAGVPDVFLPHTSRMGEPDARAGLWLEFKKPGTEKLKTGGLSDKQRDFEKFLKSQAYEHKVVYSYLQAVDETLKYLSR